MSTTVDEKQRDNCSTEEGISRAEELLVFQTYIRYWYAGAPTSKLPQRAKASFLKNENT